MIGTCTNAIGIVAFKYNKLEIISIISTTCILLHVLNRVKIKQIAYSVVYIYIQRNISSWSDYFLLFIVIIRYHRPVCC